ncbi:MAG: S41 family peptidase [Phycisphaerales bacterium]|nr:S41 family peptidase [Phycisphaerales bacterium]MCB9857088.1 S41 family peptidase [Phycisphaerales bacterium]MCB9861785.1 S41 family peptidase [Phycisphaerales bacterium]
MPKLNRNLVLALVAVIALPAIANKATADDRLASAEARRLWLKGADQILAGNFTSGTTTLKQALEVEPAAQIRSALGWMDEARKVASQRATFRKQMYDYYVAKAMESAEKARTAPETVPEPAPKKADTMVDVTNKPKTDGDNDADELPQDDSFYWSRALLYAQSAMANAADEDTFRNEAWLGEIVGHVLKEIDEHKGREEWRDALALYDLLHELFPDNDDYKAGYDFCRKRAHLDFIYGKDSKDWKPALYDVSADAVFEIIDRINNDYVDEPNWRLLCSSAIDNLLILAETKTLDETFKSLDEKDLVARFTRRLEGYKSRDIEQNPDFSARHAKSVFRNVLAVNTETIDLPTEVIVDEFIAGLLDPMDEFTSVIWPSEVNEFNKQTRGEFTGVGIQITQEPGKPVRVESPLPDSPAYNAGIKPGDFITKVDGVSTIDMSINDAVRKITGVPGTTVTLSILDENTQVERDVPLKRSQIKIRTVKGDTRDPSKPTGWNYIIDPQEKIGYIRVSGFMDDTVDDLRAALNQLHNENCRGLILDLRFNPGGLLTSAVDMCEVFLGTNARIVQTKGRSRHQNMELHAQKEKENFNLPMIVLINEYSASASEIVAGALSGLKEACVVGTRSFGKGSVQNLIPILGGRAYLKLTTAHYYVPDSDMPAGDQWYLLHRKEHAKTWGVEPHIKVDLIPQETAKVLRLRRERDLLKGKGQDLIPEEIVDRRASSEPPENFPEDAIPEVDPQLVAAMNVMRMKLASHQPWALAPRTVRTAANTKEMREIRDADPQMR